MLHSGSSFNESEYYQFNNEDIVKQNESDTNLNHQIIGMIQIGPANDELKTTKHRVINKALWVFGATRNAIVVIICGAIGFSFAYDGSEPPMKLIGMN